MSTQQRYTINKFHMIDPYDPFFSLSPCLETDVYVFRQLGTNSISRNTSETSRKDVFPVPRTSCERHNIRLSPISTRRSCPWWLSIGRSMGWKYRLGICRGYQEKMLCSMSRSWQARRSKSVISCGRIKT